ncbi:hypothetical protein [Desulfobacula sp.]
MVVETHLPTSRQESSIDRMLAHAEWFDIVASKDEWGVMDLVHTA